MKLKSIFALGLVCMPLNAINAGSLINEMQGCQGLLQFVDSKLKAAPAKYSAKDVASVRKGLQQYNAFIQKEVVTPSLLQYNGGDKAKADLMQKQVNAYKDTVIKSYQSRYPQPRLFTDQAMAINNCTKKIVPKGQALEDLKVALQTMVKLAQMK